MFPVKLTDPLSALLYITFDFEHMDNLKHTIHVREINIGKLPIIICTIFKCQVYRLTGVFKLFVSIVLSHFSTASWASRVGNASTRPPLGRTAAPVLGITRISHRHLSPFPRQTHLQRVLCVATRPLHSNTLLFVISNVYCSKVFHDHSIVFV